MTIYRFLLCLFLLLSLCFIVSCDMSMPVEAQKKELLIYCGVTMSRPVQEIARYIEKQENCIVKISQGGSGTLYHALQVNKKGDLFLPGSESYMQTCMKQGLITETVPAGYNRASFLVAKGNPLGIKPKLTSLLNPAYRIVLGSPESGSIGRETKRMLDRYGMTEQVYSRVDYLTSDSRGLAMALLNNKADLVVNWYSCGLWQENSEYVDPIELLSRDAKPHTLVLGLLESSYYPGIAKRFMEYAASEEGKAIFCRYGFGGK